MKQYTLYGILLSYKAKGCVSIVLPSFLSLLEILQASNGGMPIYKTATVSEASYKTGYKKA